MRFQIGEGGRLQDVGPKRDRWQGVEFQKLAFNTECAIGDFFEMLTKQCLKKLLVAFSARVFPNLDDEISYKSSKISYKVTKNFQHGKNHVWVISLDPNIQHDYYIRHDGPFNGQLTS